MKTKLPSPGCGTLLLLLNNVQWNLGGLGTIDFDMFVVSGTNIYRHMYDS